MEVKFRVEQRPNRGMCTVAAEFIPKGTVTWRADESKARFFRNRPELEAYLADKSAARREHILVHAFGCKKDQAVLLLDETDLVNHDPRPNTVHDNARLVEWAVRDIEPGEEITNDYRQFGRVSWFEDACREHSAVSCIVFADAYGEGEGEAAEEQGSEAESFAETYPLEHCSLSF